VEAIAGVHLWHINRYSRNYSKEIDLVLVVNARPVIISLDERFSRIKHDLLIDPNARLPYIIEADQLRIFRVKRLIVFRPRFLYNSDLLIHCSECIDPAELL
jgi:hypothetical protein